jgi:hypothetical protein
METVTQLWLSKFLEFQKQHYIETCELYLTKLGTDSALDHKTKFLVHDNNYNFYLGPTSPCKQSKLLFNLS